MSCNWLCLLPVLPASVLARDDFRRRRVGTVWLAALGLAAALAGSRTFGVRIMGQHALCNALLSTLLFCSLAFWLWLRHGMPPALLFTRAVGAGDWAILLAAAPLYAPAAYVRLQLAGSLAALAWWMFLRPGRRRTIPLAGFLALAVIGDALCRYIGLW